MKQNLFLGLIAALNIALLSWIIKPHTSEFSLKNYLDQKPQEYMKDAFVSIYSEEGSLKNELSSQYWAYLPREKISRLVKPYLKIYKKDGSTWLINALKGKALQPTIGTIEQLELQQEVVIERPQTTSLYPLKLETSQITYEPKTEIAKTNQFITMTKPGLKVTGFGMRAYLNQGSVELLQDVKTFYTTTQ